MWSIRVACLVIGVAGLAGCATAPSLQGARPISSQNQKYGLAKNESIAKTDHMTQSLNEGQSIFYFQNQGGGGVGLGLLLGPLGAAANMKMIESVTMGDVEKLKGKINLNPEAELQQAASSTDFPLQLSVTQGDIKVTPFAFISKTNETTVHVSSVILFEGQDEQKKWVRRYQYQLPGMYTLDELSAFSETKTSELQIASVAAYKALLTYIAGEKDEAIAQERKITYSSPYISPRFDFEMMGSLVMEKAGRVWICTVTGVIAVDPSDIKYQVAKN